MKQMVSILRRRGRNKERDPATEGKACDNATKDAANNALSRPDSDTFGNIMSCQIDSDDNQHNPARSIEIRRDPATKVDQTAKDDQCVEAKESTPAIIPDATMKASGRKLLGYDVTRLQSEIKKKENSVSKLNCNPGYSGKEHLYTQEQMWYKNLEDAARSRNPTRLSSRYESSDRGFDRYSDSIDRNANSPKGIDEFDSDSVGTTLKHCDSKRLTKMTNSSSRQSHGGDSCTDMSSSLFDDTHTNQSSSFFDEEDSRTDASDSRTDTSGFYDDYLEESTTIGSSTLDGTASASTPYLFELVDDGYKQRRKYQLGVGQHPNFSSSSKSRGLTRQTCEGTSTARHAHAHKPQRHHRKNPKDDSNFANDSAVCLLQIFEELSGTYMDARLALSQVLCAFNILPDDIDGISDTISNARLELMDMCQEQTRNKKQGVSVSRLSRGGRVRKKNPKYS